MWVHMACARLGRAVGGTVVHYANRVVMEFPRLLVKNIVAGIVILIVVCAELPRGRENTDDDICEANIIHTSAKGITHSQYSRPLRTRVHTRIGRHCCWDSDPDRRCACLPRRALVLNAGGHHRCSGWWVRDKPHSRKVRAFYIPPPPPNTPHTPNPGLPPSPWFLPR